MSPKTREGKTFSRQPLHIQQDIKTILYSIIFYTAVQAPLGAMDMVRRTGAPLLLKKMEAAIKSRCRGLFDRCTWRRYTGS